MKTNYLFKLSAIVIAGIFSVQFVHGQTNCTYGAGNLGGSGCTQPPNVGTCTDTYIGNNAGAATISNSVVNNTFIGGSAGLSNTYGTDNTAVGFEALKTQAYGGGIYSSYNTAIGVQALFTNNPSAVNNSGRFNTALGWGSAYSNTTGQGMTLLGYSAGYKNTADYNVFVGYQSGYYNTSGSGNVQMGLDAGFNNAAGSNNTSVGYMAGFGVSTNDNSDNCFFGYKAGYGITTGSGNVCIGKNAGVAITNAGGAGTAPNTIVGYQAGNLITTGPGNVIIGQSAAQNITTSSGNVIIGSATGAVITTNGSNTLVGGGSNLGSNTYSNCTALGNGAGTNGINSSNDMELGNTSVLQIWSQQTAITAFSDRRIKKNIKENVPGLAFINLLKPVTYCKDIHKQNSMVGYPKRVIEVTPAVNDSANGVYYPALTQEVIDTSYWEGKYDIEKITYSGLIAQQVDSAARKIGYEFSGISKPNDPNKLYGLNYTEFIIPLIKAVQELSKIVDSLMTVQSSQRLGGDVGSEKNKQDIILTLPYAPTLGEPQPNPNTGSTQISYYLPENASVAKIIFTDMLGKVMKEETLKAGYGLLNIDTQELPTGIYNYSLVINGKVIDNRKMIKNK